MTALITVTDLLNHVETDIGVEALQRVLDAADADIVAKYGAHTGSRTETYYPGLADERIYTKQVVDTGQAVTIVETNTTTYGASTTTLAASDYTINRKEIKRQSGGTNSSSYWAPLVTITYTPVSDAARRIMLTVDLVKLALKYEAIQSATMGDSSITFAQYEMERSRLLNRLKTLGESFA